MQLFCIKRRKKFLRLHLHSRKGEPFLSEVFQQGTDVTVHVLPLESGERNQVRPFDVGRVTFGEETIDAGAAAGHGGVERPFAVKLLLAGADGRVLRENAVLKLIVDKIPP